MVKFGGNTDLSIVKYLLGSLFTNFEAKDKVKGFPRSKLMNIYFKYILIDVDVWPFITDGIGKMFNILTFR